MADQGKRSDNLNREKVKFEPISDADLESTHGGQITPVGDGLDVGPNCDGRPFNG